MLPLSVQSTDADDAYVISHFNGQKDARSRKRTKLWLLTLTAVACLSFVLSVIALAKLPKKQHTAAASPSYKHVSKIAFGSCTAYDLRPQPVWTEGIIPAKPDAWVWLGDFAYADQPVVPCEEAPSSPECICTADFMHQPEATCKAGDPDHAQRRFSHQLNSRQYREFLEFMCPGHLGKGLFPPPGSDPTHCPRPILGVYDDHDFTWNNGNSRLPNKAVIKNMYLDALGEPQDSHRRGALGGLEAQYTLNQGVQGEEISVVLLDQRYYRDTLPCHQRRPWCEGVLKENRTAGDWHRVWCEDFLLAGGDGGNGSCCTKDEDLLSWCSQASNRHSELYAAACEPTTAQYGTQQLLLTADGSRLITPDAKELWSSTADWQRKAQESPFCDVLGMRQREWLKGVLQAPRPPLTLLASSSVLLDNLAYHTQDGRTCSDDDWGCWQLAQLNLLHTLANASAPSSGGGGCLVVITGDYHYADIKAALPGSSAFYAPHLNASTLQHPVWQVMASGMSDSTAPGPDTQCEGSYHEDLAGLRPLGKCAFFGGANFGMVEVDWKRRVAHLTVRDAAGGGVAVGRDGSPQKVAISLKTCQRVKD